jgi:hypothetical protein
MFDGMVLSLLARTAPTGLSIVNEIQTASSTKITRVVVDFLISLLLILSD